MKRKRLIVVQHAMERAKQFGLSMSQLTSLFWDSIEEPRPPGAHDSPNGKTLFRRNGTYVMVVGDAKDKRTHEDIYLLLTVYDQRMNMPAKYLYM